MSHIRLLLVALILGPVSRAADITPIQADDRLRRAAAIAKESNAVATLDRVLEIRDSVEKSFARKDHAAAERLVREAESVVEIDPGGKTMHGLPIAQLTPEMRRALDANDAVIVAAMRKGMMSRWLLPSGGNQDSRQCRSSDVRRQETESNRR